MLYGRIHFASRGNKFRQANSLRAICERPIFPVLYQTGLDGIVKNIPDNALEFFFVPHDMIVTFMVPEGIATPKR